MLKRTSEEKEKLTEDDIRSKLRNLAHSAALQQEYLENLLKRVVITQEIKIYSSRVLADIYAQRGMWGSASKVLENAANSSTSFDAKKDLYVNTAILAIKGQDYLAADDAFRKAMDFARPTDKAKIQQQAKEMFMSEALSLEKNGKIAKAAKLFERILRETASKDDKKRIMSSLMVLYEKLARIPESINMRELLKNM